MSQLIHSTAINRTERDLIELKYFEILWNEHNYMSHIIKKNLIMSPNIFRFFFFA